MINAWDAIASKFNADMVGGQLIAFVNGKHVCLGTLTNGTFNLSLDGHALSNEVDELDHDGDGRKGGSKGRRTRGQTLSLELIDEVPPTDELA